MSDDLRITLEDINLRLLNIDKVANEQHKENEELKKRVEELEKFYQVTYETAKKHKELNDKYKKICGLLPSEESTGGNNSRGKIGSESKIPEVG